MSGETSLQAENLSFKIGTRSIVADFSGSLAPGEWLTVVGLNGAGKSTLLKLLVGLLTPSTGRVTLNGEPVATMNAQVRAQRISFLPQRSTVPERLTVEELVGLSRFPYRENADAKERDQRAIRLAMESAGVQNLAMRAFGSLSGGEQQRALVASLLAQSSPLLVVDEPSTFLDVVAQDEILSVLKKAQKECGLTVVTVMHDLNAALRYSDRLLGLKDGVTVGSWRASQSKVHAESELGEFLCNTFARTFTILSNPVSGGYIVA